MEKIKDRGQGNVVKPEEMEFNAMKEISEGEMVPSLCWKQHRKTTVPKCHIITWKELTTGL